jgi:hypothetical protein
LSAFNTCGILLFLHSIFCFVKVLRWWGVTRFTQHHVLTYMFCSYVISTLYRILEESKLWTSKRYLFLCTLLTTLCLEKWI